MNEVLKFDGFVEISYNESVNIDGGSITLGFGVLAATVAACAKIVGAAALTTVSVSLVAAVAPAAIIVGVAGAAIAGGLIGSGIVNGKI